MSASASRLPRGVTISRLVSSRESVQRLPQEVFARPYSVLPHHVWHRIATRFATDASVHALVARANDTDVLGFVIAIRHPVRFWRRLLLRAPWIGGFVLLQVYAARASRKVSNGQSGSREHKGLPEFVWLPSSEATARVIMIWVRPEARGMGLGRQLYRSLENELGSVGVRTVEAHIDSGNERSIQLHRSEGWDLVPTREGYHGTKTVCI